LHDSLGFSVDSQDNGPLALLELLQELAGLAPKIRQRLDVFSYVQHSVTRTGAEHLIRRYQLSGLF
jgi:hypothetical protein